MMTGHQLQTASIARRPISLGLIALITGVMIPAVLVLDGFDLVGDVDTEVIVVLITATAFAFYLAHKIWPADASTVGVHMRTAIETFSVAAIVYSSGWGPALIFAFTLLFALNIREFGSRIARPTMGWFLLATFGGQLVIASGQVATFVPEPEVHGLAVVAALGSVLIFGFFGDVARLQEQAEVEVRRGGERFRSLVQNTSDVIAIVDSDGRFRYLSPAAEEVVGYRTDELIGTLAFDLINSEDMSRATDLQMEVLANPGGTRSAQLRVLHGHGGTRWVEAKLSNRIDDPSVGGIVVNYRDIEDRKKFEEQLNELAYSDSLTGLSNRVMFMERTEQALARAKRRGSWVSLLFCDLDGFKAVNDTHGHQTGDGLLTRFAERLRTSTRAEDTVARLGGDEFTVLLEDLHYPEDTLMVARRVLDSCSSPFVIDGTPIEITASIGVATNNGDGSPAQLIERADKAMYEAKRKGKNRLEITGIDFAPLATPQKSVVAEREAR